SALALPWLVKFLWAPLVDRYGSVRFGHYRSWIVPLQLLTVLAVVALSRVDLGRGLTGLLVAAGAFMLCSATQDIATDGLAVRSLRREERGLANGIQVGGYYLGQILGGGLILIVFSRFGWSAAVLSMALFLALPLWPTTRFREPGHPPGRTPGVRVDWKALGRFATRSGAGVWILILLLYRSGEAMALTMVNPMLVDLGLTLDEIGLLLGLAGSLASFAGAVGGGLWIARVGRRRSLVVFGLLQAVALGGYLLPASGFTWLPAIYAVTMTAACCSGMATAALYTNMMDRCDPATGATDFTLQQSLCAVGPLVAASLSGFSAASLGYAMHFGMTVAVALIAVGVVAAGLTEASGAPRPAVGAVSTAADA
ncbi:MAG TPA: MFS transporter, partial [Candidatus Polarisedimenticolaceae bacterium]|nr:MFS transporter [Candidatus Polarisedimenticolaceae bacterium]